MSIFQDITLNYQGHDYTVKADRVMELIAVIEDKITLQDLTTKPSLSRVAMGYAEALRFAGARGVDSGQIYKDLFSGGNESIAAQRVTELLMIMMPPDTFQPAPTKKKPTAAKAKSAPSRSKRPTK